MVVNGTNIVDVVEVKARFKIAVVGGWGEGVDIGGVEGLFFFARDVTFVMMNGNFGPEPVLACNQIFFKFNSNDLIESSYL